MRQEIIQFLQKLEMQYQVKILYACEAGSRSWGVESPNSDYDVRFIYVRPKDAYLHLDAPRDFIEVPAVDDLDISGWDIYKALRLLRRTNLSLVEWLFSPMIYLENSQAIAEMRHIARSPIASRVSLYYQYLRMASSNYRQFIQDNVSIRAKKYLYVVRPLIMLLYLEQHNGEMPCTINFVETLASTELSDEVRMHINEIVARKRADDEQDVTVHDMVLDRFIENCLEQWQARTFSDQHDSVAIVKETAALLERLLATI